MNKQMDFFLAKVLNQWVAKRRPPADGRAQLLQKAATPIRQSPNKFALSWITGQEAFRPDILGVECPRKLPGWLFFTLQTGYGNI
jgi:hypothetical protein